MKTLIMTLVIAILSTQAYGKSPVIGLSESTQSNLPGIISEETVANIMCEDGMQISDHMRNMGFIIRGLRELVQNIIDGQDLEKIRAIVMEDSQVLRTHLTAVLPKTPEKIKSIDKNNVQKNKIIFQRYLVKMISFTIDLEEELLKKPMTPDEIKIQRLKIANLIVKIDETINEAHELFRK